MRHNPENIVYLVKNKDTLNELNEKFPSSDGVFASRIESDLEGVI